MSRFALVSYMESSVFSLSSVSVFNSGGRNMGEDEYWWWMVDGDDNDDNDDNNDNDDDDDDDDNHNDHVSAVQVLN